MQLSFLLALAPGLATLGVSLVALVRRFRGMKSAHESVEASLVAAQKDRVDDHERVQTYRLAVDGLSSRSKITNDQAGRLRSQIAEVELNHGKAVEAEDALLSSLKTLTQSESGAGSVNS